ncbi:hypothetical protein V1508DRAFT_436146, partial [Lipomyces doorenjongii]|uniref:uncharacterized protein n=1 Tax=Lipomyces doorenjongii TaxID=383834 RepID=UPI0034CDD97A
QILDIPNTVNYRIGPGDSGNDNNPPGSASGPNSGPSESSIYSQQRRLMEMARASLRMHQQGAGGSSHAPPYPSEYFTHDAMGEMRRRGNDFSSDTALAGYYYQAREGRHISERSQEGYDNRSGSAFSSSSNITGRYANFMDPAAHSIRGKEISGIAWSDEDSGSVIVGWESGIGKWTVGNDKKTTHLVLHC